jgi:hypothetical protein
MLDALSKVRSSALRFCHTLSVSLLAALRCLTSPATSAVPWAPSCQIASPHANIQHVIYIQFNACISRAIIRTSQRTTLLIGP